MLKFPESFEDRPVCFIGLAAGMWGALRPVEQLQMIFSYRNAHLYKERVFIPGINDAFASTDRLKPEYQQRLEKQASGFLDYVQSLRC